MTKEEILAMEAGEELDALVSEGIMGCPKPDFIPEHALELALAGSPVRYNGWLCICFYDEGDVPKWIPDPYSTDISAAWQVVEKMKDMIDNKRNQLLCCLKIHCDIPGEAWDIHWSYSELSIMDDGHKDHKLPLSWFSLPEAICKAALLIREIEKLEEGG
ncbi:hypothetical protein ES703_38845 [subsurface metagenome]